MSCPYHCQVCVTDHIVVVEEELGGRVNSVDLIEHKHCDVWVASVLFEKVAI